MGYRLSKIYTRTGDQGDTGLGDGTRISKDDLRVETFGEIDELNSIVGWVISLGLPAQIQQCLTQIQQELFNIGGELCIPGHCMIDASHVEKLEMQLDQFNDPLPPLKDFILPGGSQAAAACHMARTVCRRCERRLVTLSQQTSINNITLAYLNRLSDLLFVIARVLARQDGGEEILWNPGEPV